MKWLLLQKKEFLLVSFFGILIAVAVTFPVAVDPAKIIFGYAGDNFGNIWYFWWQKYAAAHGLNPAVTSMYNAPFGESLNSSLSEYLWMVPGRLLSGMTSEILTFNLIILTGFALSFVSMYYLVFYLTKNRIASVFGGLVFFGSPYHLWQASSHLSLSLTFWLPLFILALFYFDEHRNFRSAVYIALTFLLTIYTTLYYGFFCFLIAVVYFGLKFIFNPREYLAPRVILPLLLSAAVVVGGVWPLWQGMRLTKNESLGVKEALFRKLDELVGLSARPWDFVIYPPNHPIFGRYNKQIYDFIQSKGNDFKVRSAYLPERVVFLGLTNTLLALLALIVFVRTSRTVRLVFIMLSAVFIISLPPYFPVKGITFYTPSYFLYQFFPFIRVYVRLGVFVLLLTTLLSAFYISYLDRSLKSERVKKLLLGLIFLAAIFEFLPNFKFYTDLRNLPPSYDWVAKQPGDFIIAEYPAAFDLQVGLLYQRYHEKRLFNMPSGESRYTIWQKVKSLADPGVYNFLKESGVAYVVYHTQDLAYNPYDDWRFFRSASIPGADEERAIESSGFKKVTAFPEAIIYKL